MKGVTRKEDRHFSGLLASSSLKHDEWQTEAVSLNEREELPSSRGENSELLNNCLCTMCHRQQMECGSLPYNRTHTISSNCFSNSRSTTISSLMTQLRQLTLLTLLLLSLLNQIKLSVAAPLVDEPALPERCLLPFSYYDCGGFQETRYTFRNGSCHMAIEWVGPDCEYDGTENSFSTKEACEEVCTAEEPPAGNLNPPLLFPPLNDAQPSTPTTTSQTAGTAGGDPLSSTDPSSVDTSVCLQPLGDITCTSFSFPTTYYFYDTTSQSCQSRISFCTTDLPGYFEMREDCLDSCERPLNPPPTTTPPTTTTAGRPATTMQPQNGTGVEPDLNTTSESYAETTSEMPTTMEPVSMTTQQKTNNEVTTTTSTPATPTTTTTDDLNEKTTDRTLALLTTDSNNASLTSQNGGPTFNVRLNKFDVASLALGLIAVVLIMVLVMVISLSMYSRHARLRRQKQEVMDSKKTEVRTLAFTATRQEKTDTVKHSSMSSTSSTISSYLTTV